LLARSLLAGALHTRSLHALVAREARLALELTIAVTGAVATVILLAHHVAI
jgi:hypothetical protein